MAEPLPRPSWLDNEDEIPPYPVLRCPRCKKLFSDHGIHICVDLNKPKEKTDGMV